MHPLSQDHIKKGFPIPDSTSKFVMDRVEKFAAHLPLFVHRKMDNIIAH
ncbi:MAG: hypothetical protein IPF55_09585 [Rhodoferax sp.]|nr:hypothetical protein [Rhodoferax sp.]